MIQNYSLYPNITLDSNFGSMELLISALNRISTRASGDKMLREINNLCHPGTGKSITIQAINSDYSETGSTTDSLGNPKDAKKRWIFKGPGTSAVVNWNPYYSLTLDAEGIPVDPDYGNLDINYIGLAHELVHAYRILRGTYIGGGHLVKENRAVGLGKMAVGKFSENSIRAEHGEPKRTRYLRKDGG